MRMFKRQFFIFLIIFVRNSWCAIDALYDIGDKVWNFYLVLNKLNSSGLSNPTTVRELFDDNYRANEPVARQMLRIHEETNGTEISMHKETFLPFSETVTSNAMIFECLDKMEIFVSSINDDYKEFYEIVIKYGYILNNQLGDLPRSVFQDIESKIRMIRKIMTAAEALLPGEENLITAITNYIVIQRETLCGDIQPITEVLIQLFRTAIIAEIKFSVMFSVANIYRFPKDQEWKTANNFARMQFRRYFASYITILKDNLGTIENLYVRACDPDRGGWILDENAYELDGFTQSAIFKYDWTKCGSESCEDMWHQKRNQCDTRFHDERSGCANILNECTKLYGVTACVLKNGPRIFQYVNSTELGLLGNNSKCPEDDAYIIDDRSSKYRTCGCNCDDYHYNISVSLLESKGGNMVITGLRFTRKDNILHIQPRIGNLGKNGYIMPNSERWLHIPNDPKVVYSGTINAQDSVFFLNDLHLPSGFVLTGVKFTQVNRQFLDGFIIEVIGVPFDYKSGQLDYNGRVSMSESIDSAGLPIVFQPINSLGMNLRNKPSSGDRLFIQFKRSLLENDFGQSTLPLFDAVPIRTNPPSALGGMGIFHKGVDGFAGFISLRAYGLRYTGYFENFTAAHTIDDEFQLFT